MLKLSSSRGIRIDVPVLSVSWFFEDHSVIIQALRKDLSSTRPVILEESLVGSPLAQIVWQRLQAVVLGPDAGMNNSFSNLRIHFLMLLAGVF